MTSIHPAIKAGATALITGGAQGIGLAVAQYLSKAGMSVVLVDRDADALDAAVQSLPDAHGFVCDVADPSAMQALATDVAKLPPLSVLFNNAGAGLRAGHCWENSEKWQAQMNVNFGGIMNGVQAFVPMMQAHGQPSLVINTGSKQGITKPPGDYAYNVSKAAVLAFTECLAHDLRGEEGNMIDVHLLVPGFTYSSLISKFIPEKPDAAWTCEQVADFMMERIGQGDFYILCPDNDVDRATDNKRIAWALGDLIENRPPLSRWHPDYTDAFNAFMKAD